jgi:hypothetical protein
MRILKIWLLAGIFFLFNCNFGMVEYAALHPQTEKSIPADSTRKQAVYAPSKEMAVVSEPDQQKEESQLSISELIWSGIKFMSAIVLKIITSVI